MVFEDCDGRRVDVCIRLSRDVPSRYDRREARLVAEDRLAGSPSVWLVMCEDWTHGPVTREAAESILDELLNLNLCHNEHTITHM